MSEKPKKIDLTDSAAKHAGIPDINVWQELEELADKPPTVSLLRDRLALRAAEIEADNPIPEVDSSFSKALSRAELDAGIAQVEAMSDEDLDPGLDLSNPEEAAKLRESATTIGTTPGSMEIVRNGVPNHLDAKARQVELAKQFHQADQQPPSAAS